MQRRDVRRAFLSIGIILVTITQLANAKEVKDITLSDQSDETKVESPASKVSVTIERPQGPLVASNSDKVEARTTKAVKNNIAEIIRGDEKFKTAAATPFGYAANGLGDYNSQLAGGAYAAGAYAGYAGPHGGGIHGYNILGGQPGIVGHGHGLVGGHPVGPEGYGGVVYAGHGNGLGFGQEQVNDNKHSEVGIGPFGINQRRDSIQKSVNRIEGAGVGIATPINYYGNQGVVYMGHGNGGIPGGYLGPVQHNILNRHPLPYDGFGGHGLHGINPNPIDIDLNRGNPYHHQIPVPLHHGHGLGGYAGPGGYQQQGFSVNKQSEVGVDPYGGIHRNVNVQKSVAVTDGLGYNGVQNNVIAHTDQAYIGPGGYGGGGHGYAHQGFAQGGGLGGYGDPYLNQLDPIYNHRGHHSRLLTTGPHRFYSGANPAGIYERHHRYG